MTATVDSPGRDNPFPGLRPFRSDEHHLFFGREEQTAALLHATWRISNPPAFARSDLRGKRGVT